MARHDYHNAVRLLPPHRPLRSTHHTHSDRIADGLRKKLNADLSLAQVLESATWKGGREIAKEKRPETCGPPLEIESDGTVF